MSFNKKTILVVDDNKTFILYLGILLRRMGFNVVPADDGMEALKLLKLTSPDLIIMDINMPILGGFDTLSQIRADDVSRNIPVVIMSGDPGEELLCKNHEAGCDGFLEKPVQMDRLHELMQDCIYSPMGWRRRFLQVRAEIVVMVTSEGGTREFQTETLSEGGLYLKTDEPFAVGTEMDIVIPYEERSLRLRGNVIYFKAPFESKQGIPAGMAVEFREVSEQDAQALNRLVSSLISRDFAKEDTSAMHNPDDGDSPGLYEATDG